MRLFRVMFNVKDGTDTTRFSVHEWKDGKWEPSDFSEDEPISLEQVYSALNLFGARVAAEFERGEIRTQIYVT